MITNELDLSVDRLHPIHHDHPHVAHVRMRRAGLDEGIDLVEEVVGAASGQVVLGDEIATPVITP